MSNHAHLVLAVQQDVAAAWEDKEVATRWLKLFGGKPLVRSFVAGEKLSEAQLSAFHSVEVIDAFANTPARFFIAKAAHRVLANRLATSTVCPEASASLSPGKESRDRHTIGNLPTGIRPIFLFSSADRHCKQGRRCAGKRIQSLPDQAFDPGRVVRTVHA